MLGFLAHKQIYSQQAAVYPHLQHLASSAVERVFSQGGVILLPHRTRMSDSLLS